MYKGVVPEAQINGALCDTIADQRRKRDIAYACFIPWGLVAVIDALPLGVADEKAAAGAFLIIFWIIFTMLPV